jgi:hypothetical protein
MSNTTAETVETEDSESPRSRAKTLLIEQTRNGSIPLLAGGTLILRAIGGKGGVVRKTGRLFAGTALVGFGLRQRRQHRPTSIADEYGENGYEMGTVDRRLDSHEGENPRGTENEPDIDRKTDPDEGSVQFTDDQEESQTKPDLDDESTGDPRQDDEDKTEIDLSEASMADEPNEAAGPSSVQSQPTQTDSIEPEETPDEDTSHLQADEPDDEKEETSDEAD